MPQLTAVGLHLAHRARNAAYLGVIEQRLKRAPASEASGLRRALMWIYGGGKIEPRALENFARLYASWVDEADDARAGGLATGLLDLG